MTVESPDVGPSPRAFASVFQTYEIREEDDQILYYGDPIADRERLMRTVWPMFRKQGYEVELTRRTGEFVLVAEPVDLSLDGIPWTNVALALATILSTLFVGASWYYIDDPLSPAILGAIPFTLAVMGVLGTHELGHYVLSRRHKVNATLPYFIPFPTIVGTMGAVIRMKGQIPDRKALFDIGVAGPLAGLVATAVVTAIGFLLPPITVPDSVLNATTAIQIQFGQPLLFRLIAVTVGQQGALYQNPIAVLTFRESVGYAGQHVVMNPVVIGGWIGMFITFLNLIPVGQLDGGHILRAIIGEHQERLAPFIPTLLFGLAGYLHFVVDAGNAAGVWVLWGILTTFAATFGSAEPIDDSPLDTKRRLLGVFTFLLGLLCFTPVPIQIVG